VGNHKGGSHTYGMLTRPAPGRPPPPPPKVVSVEHVETPKPITASVDIPLKLDEEL
jgi:hypothetical protein